ncbi:MAG TPA: four helix bundle protein [Thermoanaerobaculia bacterium]|nr:four helix bundle protein [Thermoanaerobaculia bacterium]
MTSERGTTGREGRVASGGYEQLIDWQRGIALVKQLYLLTDRFPTEEKFGLTAQIRRAAVSVPSNIAEGQARHTTREFIRFVSNAEGSIAELDTQLRIAAELDYCTKDDVAPIVEELTQLRKMLNALRRGLANKTST